jgi:hypothetical protein
VRAFILTLLLFGLLSPAAAAPATWPRLPHPPVAIDAATFQALLAAVNAESFADGKLERLRAVAGGRSYSFTGRQAVSLLRSFEFWIERVEALRLLPIADREGVDAVLRYFAGAPSTIATEAQRILAGGG